jgi:hypothetical protein
MSRFALVLITSVVSFGPVRGQEANPAPELPPWGTEVFRGLLGFSGCTPYHGFLRNQPLANSAYRGIIVVVSGKIRDDEPEREREVAEYVRRCVENGGSVLVAVRDPYDLSRLLPVPVEYAVTTPGLRFFGEGNTPDSLPEDQRPDCPIVSAKPFGLDALIRPDQSSEKNPFKGFPRIATYRPACLEPTVDSPRHSVPLAWLPPDCRVEMRRGRRMPRNAPFAIGSDTGGGGAGSGKLIVMADERVLSNQMIALPGTDNLPFALKLIALLKGPEDRERNKVIFVENGRYKDSFDDVKFNVNQTPPLPIPPPQMIDQLGTQLADAMVDQVDRTDAINGLLSKNQVFYARMIAVLIVILTGLALLILAARSVTARHKPDRATLPVAPLARVRPAKGLVGQMRQEVIVAGDFGPLVRDYCRELFAACGLPPGSHDRLPPVSYKGRVENTPALLADLTKLWATTYGPQTSMTLATWKDLEPMLQRVWRAAEAGRWSFAPAGAA